MKSFPDIQTANDILLEAKKMNSGLWISHSKTVGFCAKTISEKCEQLDPDKAYVLGLLHDIGRRYGVSGMKHIIDGYHFMMSLGYDECAKICLTHSFPYKNIKSYNGKNDCTFEETEFIKNFISDIQYDDYDRLIQLCDALSFPEGAVIIEKRLVDVTLRNGFNEYTLSKWKSFFVLKNYFDMKTNTNIYKLLNIKEY